MADIADVLARMEKDGWEVAGCCGWKNSFGHGMIMIVFKRPVGHEQGEKRLGPSWPSPERTPTAYSPQEDVLRPTRLPGASIHGRA